MIPTPIQTFGKLNNCPAPSSIRSNKKYQITQHGQPNNVILPDFEYKKNTVFSLHRNIIYKNFGGG